LDKYSNPFCVALKAGGNDLSGSDLAVVDNTENAVNTDTLANFYL